MISQIDNNSKDKKRLSRRRIYRTLAVTLAFSVTISTIAFADSTGNSETELETGCEQTTNQIISTIAGVEETSGREIGTEEVSNETSITEIYSETISVSESPSVSETITSNYTTENETTSNKDNSKVKKKISLSGKSTKKAVYVKKTAVIYNAYLTPVGKLRSGIRYFELKRLKNGYSMIKANVKTVFIKSANLTYKCNAKKIVSTTDTVYSYEDMKADIAKLSKAYASILSSSVVGKTADKRNLYTIVLGNKKAKKTVYIETTIHAREWKNSQLMMKLIEDICRNYDTASYDGKKYSYIFKNVKLVIMPMVNPDGVTISQYGAAAIRNKKLRNKVIKVAKGNYSTWKANARCVDINRNFKEGFGYESKANWSSDGFAGRKALSEKESQAEVAMIEKYKPVAVICYHEAGKVIYYRYNTKLLNLVYSYTHYGLIKEDGREYGSFSDYLDRKGIDNCTIENGLYPAPVPHSQFAGMYDLNKYMLVAAAKLYM